MWYFRVVFHPPYRNISIAVPGHVFVRDSTSNTGTKTGISRNSGSGPDSCFGKTGNVLPDFLHSAEFRRKPDSGPRIRLLPAGTGNRN